eukprot:g3236.t1
MPEKVETKTFEPEAAQSKGAAEAAKFEPAHAGRGNKERNTPGTSGGRGSARRASGSGESFEALGSPTTPGGRRLGPKNRRAGAASIDCTAMRGTICKQMRKGAAPRSKRRGAFFGTYLDTVERGTQTMPPEGLRYVRDLIRLLHDPKTEASNWGSAKVVYCLEKIAAGNGYNCTGEAWEKKLAAGTVAAPGKGATVHAITFRGDVFSTATTPKSWEATSWDSACPPTRSVTRRDKGRRQLENWRRQSAPSKVAE